MAREFFALEPMKIEEVTSFDAKSRMTETEDRENVSFRTLYRHHPLHREVSTFLTPLEFFSLSPSPNCHFFTLRDQFLSCALCSLSLTSTSTTSFNPRFPGGTSLLYPIRSCL